ncbi:MAG: glycoside hydrolase family 3 C-terminal domain-containing protein [Alphaproteobacteria bacterium]|nr:glycoside hydrolase family 3 C-terminal domain-containing protein [Alphaproteobacteria bacterium]MBU0794534.1 glycoside hydrolase family 3 C-terminal domain-containing protein [Alphaproteobacteria bacterium]MBU0875689.1 glycoside hydrolase family 3 C-terminal domain-containing protein [Alphaproteobacteria bacterium]MBU1768500.1 glycoside hydrolase family 3 C-terminal domain-containing protein [Alphaproteobacteria bacterium]
MPSAPSLRHSKRILLRAGAALLAAPAPAVAQSGSEGDVIARSERQAAEIVAKLAPQEKADQMLNVAPAIPRLGIPGYNWWTESLHGAMGTLPTTNFPEPIGLAATFDAPLIKDVANVISVEMRGLHTLARQTGRLGRIGTGLNTWSPNINIFRDPRWGRGQETYGEDPFLTAQIGTAFIQGLQGPDPERPNIIATPKHFAVHSGPESTRHHANVYVSRHDMEDTYLPAFRAAIVDAKAGSIMCAYNRVNGQPACASDELLKTHLRKAWGFRGYVVSDCDAVTDINLNHHYAPDAATAVTAAIRAGVDSECNGRTLNDTAGLGQPYLDALNQNLLTRTDIDTALVRLFSARLRNGDLPGLRARDVISPATIGAPDHGALALQAAEKSLVLLKNDGALPLKPDARIAVIGPLADATRVLRGNYSSTLSGPPVSVLEGLRKAMPGAAIQHAPFAETFTDGDRVPTSALLAPDGKPGLLARYYNPVETPPTRFEPGTFDALTKAMTFQSRPVVTRREADVSGRSLDLANVSDHHRVVWTGFLVPPESGTYRLGLSGSNGEMLLDGQYFVDLKNSRWNSLPTMKTVTLEKGKRHPIQVTMNSHINTGIDLMWKRVSADADAALADAAAQSDVIVAVVGLTSDLEAEETPVKVPGFEGGDKTTLDLPADQIALLEKARALGKPLVIVAMNGSPINLAWAKDNAAAIIEAWYPGQNGGLAVANVLSGKTNPSGRLPLTFYKSIDELPPFGDYSMAGRTYRYFTGTPVYRFGYGLSYTQFAYEPLRVEATGDASQGIRVSTTIRNVGQRAGEEVAQLYLDFPDVPGTPRIALRGFQRVDLKPGESRAVRFDLSPRDLSAVSLEGERQVFTGDYRVSVGSAQPDSGLPVQSASFTIRTGVALPK